MTIGLVNGGFIGLLFSRSLMETRFRSTFPLWRGVKEKEVDRILAEIRKKMLAGQ